MIANPIDNLDQLREVLAKHPTINFKNETVAGREVVVVCYSLNDPKMWDDPYARHYGRGSCWDRKTGKLISLPFHKFFNFKERAETQSNQIPLLGSWFEEKVDGSMVTPILVDDTVFFKTKKSFFSDVAKLANRCPQDQTLIPFCKLALKEGFTPIFEFTHPDARVVIDYGDSPEFKLLAVRRNVDGSYLTWEEIENVARWSGFDNFIETHDAMNYRSNDPDFISGEISEAIGREGFVLANPSGLRVKFKTKWYLDRHRMLEVRERDIFDWHLEDCLDDLMPELIHAEVDMGKVQNIIEAANLHCIAVKESANTWYRMTQAPDMKTKSRREIAQWLAETVKIPYLRKMVFRLLDNKDIDELVRDHVQKEYREQFPLRSVTNGNFGVK